jgi:pimeloyl-ACP methyl ester carboxylesterase
MPEVPITGGVLHLAEVGRGRPLLLVHGFPLDHSMWEAQLSELGDAARLLAPDLRGFGQSSVSAGTVTMERMADDLAELLDGLGIAEPIVLCGLSMGGYVAWQFVRKHGQRLAGLILCDTRAAADTPEAAATRLQTAQRVLKEGAGVVAETMLPRLLAPRSIERRPDLATRLRQMMLDAPPEGIAAALRGMAARPDANALLPAIGVPALVIVGEHDAISSPAEMQGIARAMPRARYVEVRGAGHMAPLENPGPVNDAIRDFLAELPG